MDEQTLKYMGDRVDEARRLRKEIAENDKIIDRINASSSIMIGIFNGHDYRPAPWDENDRPIILCIFEQRKRALEEQLEVI